VDHAGFHLWSFRGANELAHCSHIAHIARALRWIEDAWDTPAMDRNVPFTPAPVLGAPDAGRAINVVADNPLTAALVAERPSEPLPHAEATEEPSTPAPTAAPEAPNAPPPDERPSGEE
jgi:hypothetical protein